MLRYIFFILKKFITNVITYYDDLAQEEKRTQEDTPLPHKEMVGN